MITFTPNTTNKDFEAAIAPAMTQPIEHFEKELLKLRTGRAHTGMVEGLVVTCYGSTMTLKEVAAISAPESRLIVIQPWDKGNLAEIEKAITASDLGATPINNGEIIRIQLPQISSERRTELVKILHKKVEECRVAIRNVRKDFQNAVRSAEKDRTISEDFAKLLLEILQNATDKYIAQAESLAKKKEDLIRTE